MYSWYKTSKVCYAYLQDVSSNEDPRAKSSSFRESKWFTRGWTLQELIAPLSVVFLANDWIQLGSKKSLADVVEDVTKVEQMALLCNPTYKASVAKRMSWAANRQTTRVEDRAYSLMGLFAVNMPIIYGEGSRAFARLEEEIMRVSSDHTLFAWKAGTKPSKLVRSGLLATSPDEFADASNFEPMESREFESTFGISGGSADYTMTNFGVRIRLPLEKESTTKNVYRAYLACHYGTQQELTWIYLTVQHNKPRGHYFRMAFLAMNLGHAKYEKPPTTTTEEVFVGGLEPPMFDISESKFRNDFGYRFRVKVTGYHPFKCVDCHPTLDWTLGQEPTLRFDSTSGGFGTILFRNEMTGEAFSAILGVRAFRMWSDVAIVNQQATAHTIYNDYRYSGDQGLIRHKHHDWVKRPLGTGQQKSVLMTVRELDTTNREATFVVNITVS